MDSHAPHTTRTINGGADAVALIDRACPYVNRDDNRCAWRFTLGHLDAAMDTCLGSFRGCATYHHLNHEDGQRRRRSGAGSGLESGTGAAATSAVAVEKLNTTPLMVTLRGERLPALSLAGGLKRETHHEEHDARHPHQPQPDAAPAAPAELDQADQRADGGGGRGDSGAGGLRWWFRRPSFSLPVPLRRTGS